MPLVNIGLGNLLSGGGKSRPPSYDDKKHNWQWAKWPINDRRFGTSFVAKMKSLGMPYGNKVRSLNKNIKDSSGSPKKVSSRGGGFDLSLIPMPVKVGIMAVVGVAIYLFTKKKKRKR